MSKLHDTLVLRTCRDLGSKRTQRGVPRPDQRAASVCADAARTNGVELRALLVCCDLSSTSGILPQQTAM